MNEVVDASRDLLQALKTERDDLKVQLHLASTDLKERLETEWNNVEDKWAEVKATARHFNSEVSTITSAMEEDLEDVTDHLAENSKALLHEIRDGYRRIRNTLKE